MTIFSTGRHARKAGPARRALGLGSACVLLTSTLGVAFAAPAQAAPPSPTVAYRLASAGAPVVVSTSVLDPASATGGYLVKGEVSSASAVTDTSGLGAVMSDATATGIKADAPPRPALPTDKQLLHAAFAVADHHTPTTEVASPDDATVAQATIAGLLSASTLASTAGSSAAPSSTSQATVQSASVLPGGTALTGAARPPLSATVLKGNATADGDSADGGSNIATVTVPVPGVVTVSVQAPIVTATAGFPSPSGAPTTGSTCQLLGASVDFTNPLLPDVVIPSSDCNRDAISVPGVLTIEFGKTTTSSGADAASTRVAAVTITLPSLGGGIPTVLELATASASATRTSTVVTPGDHCTNLTPATPQASGSAEGTVATVLAGGLLRGDLSRSRAAFDTQRLPFADGDTPTGPSTARASGQPVSVQALPAPGGPALVDPGVRVTVTDSKASDAPGPGEATSERADLLSATTGPVPLPVTDGVAGLAASTLRSTATADKAAPAAAATSQAAGLSASLGLASTTDVIPVNAELVSSDATTSRSGGVVTSVANETLADAAATATPGATFNVAGAAVTASVIKTVGTRATAGGPDPASAVPGTVTIVDLRVNGEVVPLDLEADGSVRLSDDPAAVTVGPATVRIGQKVVSPPGDGTAASVTVIPVLVTIGDVSLELGRTSAAAFASAPTSAVSIAADVDQQFDAATFDDDGKTLSPHQKYWYRVCVENVGTSTLTNLKVASTLDPNITVIEPRDFLVVQVAKPQQIAATVTLAPGALLRLRVLVEIDPVTAVGTTVRFTATATGGGLPATPVATSNTLSNPVGYTTEHPALSILKVSQTFNSTTRVLSLTVKVNNFAGASPATGVYIDKITPGGGATLVSTAPPLYPCGSLLEPTKGCTIAPGSNSPNFTIQLKIPAGQTSYSVDFRERGLDPSGRTYAFD